MLQSALSVFDTWLQENCIDIVTARQFLNLIKVAVEAQTSRVDLSSKRVSSYQ